MIYSSHEFVVPQVVENLQWLCQKILDPLRTKLCKPVSISSGYRSAKLNTQIGGAATSQHCEGKSADIIVSGMSTQALFSYITNKTALPFDQVINEFGQWVHISYDHAKAKQRGQKLIAKTENGKTVYLPA